MNCGGCIAGYCQAKCHKIKRTNNPNLRRKQLEFIKVKKMTKKDLDDYGL